MPSFSKLARLFARLFASPVVAILLVAACLTACGGGGGDEPKGPSPLVSSGGDASKYLGTWHGECAFRLLAGPGTTSNLRGDFVLAAVKGGIVSGTLTTTYYPDDKCHGTVVSKSTIAIELKVDDSTIAVQGTEYTGTLDKVTAIDPTGASSSVSGYVGFAPDFKTFRLSSDPDMDLTVAYVKS